MSLKNLALLNGAFRHVRILYLGPQTISEIRHMTDIQCYAFKDIFPNLQKIMPRAQSKSPIDEVNQVRRIAAKLGLSVEPLSLQSQCVFFVQEHIPPEKIPKDNSLLNRLLSGK